MDLVERYSVGKKLNIGCGTIYKEGWVNVDFHRSVKADCFLDIRNRWSLFGTGEFDTVLASHVLEHFEGDDLFHIMYEAGRVLRPGGVLIGVVPYATSETFYANPFHKQPWTERTPYQFDKRLYQAGGGPASLFADQGRKLQPWEVECVYLRADPDWRGVDEDAFRMAARRYLNVVQEMSFVMRRVEG